MAQTPPPSADALRSGSALTHMPAIDAVRGIAILLVLAHHFTPAVSGTHFTKRMLEVAHTGWVGVDLFFVLSGFLITAILLKTRNGEDYFLNFYARRTLRIFPVYYVALTFMLLALPVLMQMPILQQFIQHYFGKVTRDLPDMVQNQSWLWMYGSNVKIAMDGTRWGLAVNHFWSLAVEEHFYLVWPLIVYFVASPAKLARLCLVCILGAPLLRGMLMLAGFDSVVPYVLTPTRVDSLAVGALVSILMLQPNAVLKWLPRFRWMAIASAVGLAGLVLLYGRYHRDDLLTTVIGYSLLALISAWAVLAASQMKCQSRLSKVLVNPVFISLGKYSYGIYVLHMFFAPAYIQLFGWTALHKLTGSYANAIVAHFILATACSWGIAWLSYNLMEKHFLRLKRFFDYRKPVVATARVPVATDAHASKPNLVLPTRPLRQAA